MKTRFVSTLSLLIANILLIPFFSNAQSGSEKFNKQYEWSGESTSETVNINIEKSSSNLMINLDGWVKKGKLEVNIYNPKGEKIPGFLLVSNGEEGKSSNNIAISGGTGNNTVTTTTTTESSTSVSTSSSANNSSTSSSSGSNSDGKGTYSYSTSSTTGSGAKGVMNKVITDPMQGKWKLEISTKKLTGSLTVSMDQQ